MISFNLCVEHKGIVATVGSEEVAVGNARLLTARGLLFNAVHT